MNEEQLIKMIELFAKEGCFKPFTVFCHFCDNTASGMAGNVFNGYFLFACHEHMEDAKKLRNSLDKRTKKPMENSHI